MVWPYASCFFLFLRCVLRPCSARYVCSLVNPALIFESSLFFFHADTVDIPRFSPPLESCVREEKRKEEKRREEKRRGEKRRDPGFLKNKQKEKPTRCKNYLCAVGSRAAAGPMVPRRVGQQQASCLQLAAAAHPPTHTRARRHIPTIFSDEGVVPQKRKQRENPPKSYNLCFWLFFVWLVDFLSFSPFCPPSSVRSPFLNPFSLSFSFSFSFSFFLVGSPFLVLHTWHFASAR